MLTWLALSNTCVTPAKLNAGAAATSDNDVDVVNIEISWLSVPIMPVASTSLEKTFRLRSQQFEMGVNVGQTIDVLRACGPTTKDRNMYDLYLSSLAWLYGSSGRFAGSICPGGGIIGGRLSFVSTFQISHNLQNSQGDLFKPEDNLHARKTTGTGPS